MDGHQAHPGVDVTASPAVLELGADVGAAVIYMPEALVGAEIEIKPKVGEWDGAHTGIRRRAGGHVAALFYGLRAGAYELRLRGDSRSMDVVGGRVTEISW